MTAANTNTVDASASSTAADTTLLRVENLHTWFFSEGRVAPAVDGLSFSVDAGRTLCIVGESGCGKSVTALSVMGLVPSPPGKTVAGSAHFLGRDLLALSPKELRKIRGRELAMIFQEPMSSLNPVMTVGNQVMESLELHEGMSPREAHARAIELLEQVGIPAPEQRVKEFPHQLSGGMKQRVMIAMALACSPKVLIADEPTTALDVTIQAQILDLLRSLQKDTGMGMLMITHDLGVVAEIADEVAVMYAGKIVERASVYSLFDRPQHPYTRGLFASLPSIASERGSRLQTIEGMVPSPYEFPTGCRFRTRCPFSTERCAAKEPELLADVDDHFAACHYRDEIAAGTKARTGPFLDGKTTRRWLDPARGPQNRVEETDR